MFAFAVNKTKRGLHFKNSFQTCLWFDAPKFPCNAHTMQALAPMVVTCPCLRCIKGSHQFQNMMPVKPAFFDLSFNAALLF
jgi:hypothetical protein